MSFNNPNNFNQPQINNNLPINQKTQVTGSQSYQIKSTPQGTSVTGKSSYNDPITGVSETAKVSTEGKQRLRDRMRDRSRSSSSQRRRRNIDNFSTQTQQTTAVNNTTFPPSNFPLNNNNYGQQPYDTTNAPINQAYNNPNWQQNQNWQTTQNQTWQQNQNLNPTLQQNQNYSNQQMTNLSSNQDPNLYAYEKGQVRTTNHGIMTREKMEIIDPRTGNQENVSIRTNTRGSGVDTNGKSMHTYENKVHNTPNGPQVEMKEKHREGGMMANLKNKINNMMH